MLELNDNFKQCLSGVNCCHPDNKNGWLNKSEFYYRKDTNKLRNHCKSCVSNIGIVKYHNDPDKKRQYQRERLKQQIQKRLSKIIKVLN